MTARQYSKLHELVSYINSVRYSPNPNISARLAWASPKLVETIIQNIIGTIEKDDGAAAYDIIKAWHEGGLRSAMLASFPEIRAMKGDPAKLEEYVLTYIGSMSGVIYEKDK